MLIIGAKGHAKEILEIFYQKKNVESLVFYDDRSIDLPKLLYNQFMILRNVEDVLKAFETDHRFVLGIGVPYIRYQLARKFIKLGGILESAISPFANLGHYQLVLERGLNIMTGVVITNDIFVGEGTLINANSTIHHDTCIGKYCEISPNVSITGHANIGNFCSIGTGAVILPHITLGANVVVGAGAVITESVADNTLVVGVPAKTIKRLLPLKLET